MKILIADDEELVRSALEGILKKGAGYETDFALDGEEALKKMLANSYDGVLLDIEMPKLDGYTILKKVRLDKPDLPVIFVTGKGNAKKVASSIDRDGLNALIEKPFTPAEVLEVVFQAVRKKAD
ncbi:MAG TPA: response regulator [Candidatus Sulfotelmatobacter sp.]|nr:response regulator [Candidatus Sulfotelmatobacter sp.]